MSSRRDKEFAAAFATLHPRLALLAEGRVDLRRLHASGDRPERFTGAVVEALQHEGVPAAALAEMDSTLTRPAPAQPATVAAPDTQRRKASRNPGLRVG
jgi:hypothetical protein